MPTKIERTLAYDDPQLGPSVIGQDKIGSFHGPVVILGDPGLGKTVLTQWLGELPGAKYVRAGKLKRTAKPESLTSKGQRIVVDGLDEIASVTPGGAVEAVLEKLSTMGYPLFVLGIISNSAEWRRMGTNGVVGQFEIGAH